MYISRDAACGWAIRISPRQADPEASLEATDRLVETYYQGIISCSPDESPVLSYNKPIFSAFQVLSKLPRSGFDAPEALYFR